MFIDTINTCGDVFAKCTIYESVEIFQVKIVQRWFGQLYLATIYIIRFVNVVAIGNDFCMGAYLQLQWIAYSVGLAMLECFVEVGV